MLEPAPRKEGLVEPVKDNVLKRFQALDQAAFARSIIADEHRERGESNGAAVAHGFKML